MENTHAFPRMYVRMMLCVLFVYSMENTAKSYCNVSYSPYLILLVVCGLEMTMQLLYTWPVLESKVPAIHM